MTLKGFEIQGFETLLQVLATRCRNECRLRRDPDGPRFTELTQATPLQQRALKLMEEISVPSKGK